MKSLLAIYKEYKKKINERAYIIKINDLESIYLECFFSDLANEKTGKYLYYKLKDIIQNEYKINVFELSSNELNKNEKDYKHWANGLYYYSPTLSFEESIKQSVNDKEQIIKKWGNINDYENRLLTYPRIEISNQMEYQYALFTLAHELGHHIIQLNGEEQSEELADYKVLEIFQKHFHPVFLGIFHIMLGVYTKGKYIIDNYNQFYLDHYMDYINNTDNELNFKLYK